jgi:hypothetical protein
MIESTYLQKLEIQYKPKIKVLLLYIVYPMAIGTYFRKALEHRSDIDLKITGVYTGNWIPWNGGMELSSKYAVPIDLPLPFREDIREVNYDMVKAQLGDWVPDLIINVDANLHWKYKPSDGMVVTIATDPHVLDYSVPRGYSDIFFNMQLCYSQEKDKYLPYAYSQYDHYPVHIEGLEDGTWKDKDACLIGLQYENRVQWVEELRRRGVSVISENGPVFDEARVLYNRARIGLSWSSREDLIARTFELPAMKLAPVMNLVPDVGRFFEQGTHYEGFTNLNEAVERVVWLKEHPVQLKELAERAYQNVQGQHYDARVDTVLKECGF